MDDAVRLIWLGGGELPTFPFQGDLHYMTGGEDDKANPKLRWHSAYVSRTVYIPIIATTLEEFLAFMEEPNVIPGKTLYIAIRSFSRIAQGNGFYNSLLLSAAIVPGDVDGAVEHPWRMEPLTQIANLCTLVECKEEPTDPILRAAWLGIEESRAITRAWNAAWERSKRLLEANLDEEQLAEFKDRYRFRVRAADGHVYMFIFETHGNIFRIAELIEPGGPAIRALVNYCIVPNADVHVPLYDQLLGQKLLLENDPEAFFATANSTEIEATPEQVEQAIEVLTRAYIEPTAAD
jgi:hypothetical protein